MTFGLWAGLSACATTPPPPPGSTAAPSAASAPTEPAPAPTEPAPVPLPTAPPPPPIDLELPAEPLAWVNPARCHPSCAFDPQPDLVSVDDRGLRRKRGRHRVAKLAAAPLHALLSAAATAGHKLTINSAYRSYEEQATVFATTKEAGRAARPGHSEHQLGTAIDLRLPTAAAIAWLDEHAPAFGFVRSYPEGKQRITGYRPEPWHIRFVGETVAAATKKHGLCLEELFRAAPKLGTSGTCGDCPEPASRSACAEIGAQGVCAGDVLSWCYDDALASVDCAASQQRCGLTESGTYDCLTPPPATALGR
jgi:zinc D-Ala-D-Ala carboxypeptidase